MCWKGQDELGAICCLQENPKGGYIRAPQAILCLDDKIGITFAVKTHWERCEPGAWRLTQWRILMY
jgi:hypothetical protein